MGAKAQPAITLQGNIRRDIPAILNIGRQDSNRTACLASSTIIIISRINRGYSGVILCINPQRTCTHIHKGIFLNSNISASDRHITILCIQRAGNNNIFHRIQRQ